MEPIKPVTPPDSLIWRIVHFPLVLLVIGMVMVLGSEISVLWAMHFLPHTRDGWVPVLAAVAAAGAAMLAYAAFVRFVERRPAVAELGARGWFKELGAGLLGGFLLFSVVVGIIAAFGDYHVIGENPVSILLPILAVSIVSGIGEEIVVRGLIFRLIESSLGTWIALIFSAALFGVGHLGNPNATWLAAAAIALEAGIMLAALYMLTRRLWAAIGLHAAWNFTQGGVYGIAVSGGAMKGLLVPRITGPDLVTGGAFGAEASLPAMIVCTAFGVVMLGIAYRRDRFVKPFWRRPRLSPA